MARHSDTLAKTEAGRKAINKVQKTRLSALRVKHPRVKAVNGHELRRIERDSPLTEQQRIFVRNWASGETPRNAAIIAGYKINENRSSNAAYWLLTRNPKLLALYHEEKKLYEQAAQMTRQKVMDMLKEAYDMAKIQSEPATMVAAAREIGKMCGYYEPEVKINIAIGGKTLERMTTMSDEELLKFVAEGGDLLEGESKRVEDAPLLEQR